MIRGSFKQTAGGRARVFVDVFDRVYGGSFKQTAGGSARESVKMFDEVYRGRVKGSCGWRGKFVCEFACSTENI